MNESINQIAVLILSASSIWFLSGPERYFKWGHFLGLCSQPFWFISFFVHGQWGMFLLEFWFALCYARGWMRYRDRKIGKQTFDFKTYETLMDSGLSDSMRQYSSFVFRPPKKINLEEEDDA